jgi:hypothetical protein
MFPARLNMFAMVDAALTEIFEKADVSGNGKITLTDYENMCVVYGIEVSEEEMLKIQVHMKAPYTSAGDRLLLILNISYLFFIVLTLSTENLLTCKDVCIIWGWFLHSC